MTVGEWLEIGYSKGIIEDVPVSETVSFYDVYKKWFCMKMHKVKLQTVDRIECTFNKYYASSAILLKCVNDIDKEYICNFLNDIIVNNCVCKKEFERIYQIIHNVMTYAYDLNIGHAHLIDWGFVSRFIYSKDIFVDNKREFMINDVDLRLLFNSVLVENIYPLKRSACLCLLMNFYLGLRIGELASLTFDDFDISQKLLKVYKTEVKYFPRDDEGNRSGTIVYNVVPDLKTRSSFRSVPLTDECIYIYRLIREHHHNMCYKSLYLCYDGNDTIMTRSLERTLTRLCKLVGISHINSHKIRKTYASRLHMAGVPTRVITDLCGHSDMETTERCYILNYEAGYSKYMDIINTALSVNKLINKK